MSLPAYHFRKLCEYGAELEDLEDSHDHEPEVDEHTLSRSKRIAQPEEESSDDGEPDLGATGMMDQRRWHDGGQYDREADPCDRGEPSLGASEVIMAGRCSPVCQASAMPKSFTAIRKAGREDRGLTIASSIPATAANRIAMTSPRIDDCRAFARRQRWQPTGRAWCLPSTSKAALVSG